MRSNPDLVEDEVWRLFEVEGTPERSLAAVDKYAKGRNTWHAAFVELAGDGTLDRDRLLDASLDALMRGFAQFRAQWFSALHEGLEPTPAERGARWRTYLGLASSPVGPTASMALRALVAVQRETDLDAFEVINGIGPALAVRAKGSAKNAIRVLCTAIAANPGYTNDGALVLAEALCHPSRDVQQAAADQLVRLVPEPDVELREVVWAHGEACHPSVRA
ncbi:MAG: hypothetical protein GY946_15675, partial [bacterium]|nr:hypothetical protein [bacterium]